jgi:uncharacterized protein DUF4149
VVIGLLRFVHLLALGLWVGEITFFSFIAAPAIFRVLGAPRAGEVVAAIFPRYYALGIAAGAIALTTAVVLGGRATADGPWKAAALALGLALAATLWAGLRVYPETRRVRAEMEIAGPASPAAERFARLHRRAVALNAASLVGALAGLGLSAGALRS